MIADAPRSSVSFFTSVCSTPPKKSTPSTLGIKLYLATLALLLLSLVAGCFATLFSPTYIIVVLVSLSLFLVAASAAPCAIAYFSQTHSPKEDADKHPCPLLDDPQALDMTKLDTRHNRLLHETVIKNLPQNPPSPKKTHRPRT